MSIVAQQNNLDTASATEPTAMHSWTVVIAQTLEHAGVDSQAIFAKADIPYKLAVNPYLRVPTHKINKLFKLSVEATSDPCFGLKMEEFIHPTTFHALGYSIFASSTLRDYFERLVRFFRIASDNVLHEIKESETQVSLNIRILVPGLSHQTQDGWTAAIVKFARMMYRPDFNPMSIKLLRPDPRSPHRNEFEKFFRCPVEFGADQWSLIFNRQDIVSLLPGANPELALINDKVVMECLAKLEKSDLAQQVKSRIIKTLPSGSCSKEKIAAELNLSPRNLQHKLELQNTSYQEVLEQTRKDLATKYLDDGHTSISEITYLLGFSDTSNFARAFRRWFGISPSGYREKRKVL